jgi:general secretion pathway protein K
VCVSLPCLNSNSNLTRNPGAERGTVLVLVLLIVALVAGLSVKFAAQYQGWRARKPVGTAPRRGRFWRVPKRLPS